MPLPPTVTIAGTDRTTYVRNARKIEINYTLGAVARFRGEVLDKSFDTSTAYRPAPDQTLLYTYGGVTHFNGHLMTVGDAVLGEPNIGVVTALTAVDKARVAKQRRVTATYEAGHTLAQIVGSIRSNYLATFGITLDPAMADGPVLDTEAVIEDESVENVFNHLSDMTGWIWRITPALVLEFFAPGTKVAPYTLSTANANIRGGPRWSKTRTKYVNRVTVVAGTPTQVEKTKLITLNGITTSWVLDYPLVLDVNGLGATRGYVTEGGVIYPLYGSTWTLNGATRTLTRSSPGTNGTAVSFTYTAQFPIRVTAQDAAEIALNQEWEDSFPADDIFDIQLAQDYANAILRKYKSLPRMLSIKTSAGFVLPGDVVTVTVSERTLSGDWLIVGVTVRDEADQGLLYELECIEGTEAQASWVEFWKNAIGKGQSSATNSGRISASLVPALSGVFTTDVVANSSQSHVTDGSESALRSVINSASYSGPGLVLGRSDSTFAWSLVADYLKSSPVSRGLYFVPLPERLSTRAAMRLGQDVTGVDGTYWLTPMPSGTLNIGAKETWGFGPTYRVNEVNGKTLDIVGYYEPAVSASHVGSTIGTTIQEAASGTHASVVSLQVNPPTILSGAAATTDAIGLLINGAPTGATNNYAAMIAAAYTGVLNTQLRNTAAGTANVTRLSVGNDTGAGRTILDCYSSTFTTAGKQVAEGTLFQNNGAGGLSLGATGSGGVIRFYAGSDTEKARIDGNTTANETGLLLTVAGGGIVRVSVGANDSGGAGFRVLRVPN